jgi:hypothetical protein
VALPRRPAGGRRQITSTCVEDCRPDVEERRSKRPQMGIRKANVSGPLPTCRKLGSAQSGASMRPWDKLAGPRLLARGTRQGVGEPGLRLLRNVAVIVSSGRIEGQMPAPAGPDA